MTWYKSNVFRGLLLTLFVIGIPIGYWEGRNIHYRNFRTVDPGYLYRSGQLDTGDLQRLSDEFGIKTIVTFRDADNPGDPIPDQHEVDFAATHNIRHLRISPAQWSDPNGGIPPITSQIALFLKAMDEARAEGPILIHCFAGIHRTGAYTAIYRMEYDGWSNEDAILEMEQCGYTSIHDDLDTLHYLQNYVPRSDRKTTP